MVSLAQNKSLFESIYNWFESPQTSYQRLDYPAFLVKFGDHQVLEVIVKFYFWCYANLSELINSYIPWNHQKTID